MFLNLHRSISRFFVPSYGLLQSNFYKKFFYQLLKHALPVALSLNQH